MAWTEITRAQYRRDGLRYASDATDAEWAVISPLIPPARRLGRPRRTALRAVVDAIFYVLTTGRSEEHTSELQSLMRISYAVFCLKKKNTFASVTEYIL